METKSWKDIKDTVYGKKGTERRDELDRDFESFKRLTVCLHVSWFIPENSVSFNEPNLQFML